jgi:acetolactate synthase I/II/III large subunit
VRRRRWNRDVMEAARILEGAAAPAILVGPGARRAMDLIAGLARRLKAPVLTTPDAKSMFDEAHPHSAGVFSFAAPARARAVVAASDVILAIGTNLGEFASGGGKAFENKTVLHFGEDPGDISIGIPVTVAVVGDLAATVRTLFRAIARIPSGEPWFARVDAAPAHGAQPSAGSEIARSTGISPGEAVRAITDALPSKARLACDVTSAALHVLHNMTLGPDQRLWLQIEKSACMGSALGTGLGIRLASDLATVVLIGDWGLMMGQSELHTAASLGIGRFVVVVWSNAGGALIRTGVRAQGLDVPSETHTWTAPRFAWVARGYGLRSLTIRSTRALRRSLAVALRAPFPVLIDAIIDPDAPIPGAEARYVHLDTSTRSR